MKQLGKIEKVELRDIWPHEALDFTKWLSEEENLDLLSDAIGIELELIETESSVGSFSADIFAQETGTGRKVIVENQLEATNHDHLGKVITYAAGKGASLVVWVVAQARDEHRQAIEWLNQHTDSEFGFFLIEIELWSIDGSAPAPRFNVVERPNDWAKSIKAASGLSETDALKLRYWQAYSERAQGNYEFMKVMRPQKAQPQHWTTLHIGSSSYHIALLIATARKEIGIEFYIPEDREIYAKAEAQLARFEECVGIPGKLFSASKASGIRFYKPGCDVKGKPEKWNEFIDWQLSAALRLRGLIKELEL